jgi:hypothetical protein
VLPKRAQNFYFLQETWEYEKINNRVGESIFIK